ncbi:MAG: DHH family phosphoesterase [Planctomycetota bacterium]
MGVALADAAGASTMPDSPRAARTTADRPVRREAAPSQATESEVAPPTFDGQSPVDHLEGVLRATIDASATRPARFLILTHMGPDPDAIGACEGLRLLLERGFEMDCVVATHGRVHRAENVALLRTLDLDLAEYQSIDTSEFCGVLLVDTQPAFKHTVVPADPPVVAVFDHHRSPQSADSDAAPVPHEDVRVDLGATSSILYEYLRDKDVELDPSAASALFCGIRYDTADLSRNVSPLDEEAYIETFKRGDRPKIAAIDSPPLARSYYRHVAQALTTARQHGPLVIALLGRVENPEHVAEMADFFLRMKGCSWVVAGGAYENSYVLSLRTDYAFGKAYPLIERVLGDEGSFGGHGHIAGGRIPLEDEGMSAIKSIERRLRKNALAVIASTDDEGSDVPEGRRLDE